MELTTQNLTAGYGDKRILDELSLSLPAGKITALLGPNGCGKSTLLKCFAKLLTPESGAIELNGKPLSAFSARQLSRHLALLPQQHLTPEGITVRDLVAYGRSPWLSLWGRLSQDDRQHVQRAMEKTHIVDLADKRLTDLSGGNVSGHFWQCYWHRIRPSSCSMNRPPTSISIIRLS